MNRASRQIKRMFGEIAPVQLAEMRDTLLLELRKTQTKAQDFADIIERVLEGKMIPLVTRVAELEAKVKDLQGKTEIHYHYPRHYDQPMTAGPVYPNGIPPRPIGVAYGATPSFVGGGVQEH